DWHGAEVSACSSGIRAGIGSCSPCLACTGGCGAARQLRRSARTIADKEAHMLSSSGDTDSQGGPAPGRWPSRARTCAGSVRADLGQPHETGTTMRSLIILALILTVTTLIA